MGQKEIHDLLKENGEMTVKEMADYFQTSYNTINIYIQKMLKKGEIERRKVYVGARKHPTYYYYRVKE